MAGICESCKNVAELRSCPVCGARICLGCTGKNGCKNCQGIKFMK